MEKSSLKHTQNTPFDDVSMLSEVKIDEAGSVIVKERQDVKYDPEKSATPTDIQKSTYQDDTTVV